MYFDYPQIPPTDVEQQHVINIITKVIRDTVRMLVSAEETKISLIKSKRLCSINKVNFLIKEFNY